MKNVILNNTSIWGLKTMKHGPN